MLDMRVHGRLLSLLKSLLIQHRWYLCTQQTIYSRKEFITQANLFSIFLSFLQFCWHHLNGCDRIRCLPSKQLLLPCTRNHTQADCICIMLWKNLHIKSSETGCFCRTYHESFRLSRNNFLPDPPFHSVYLFCQRWSLHAKEKKKKIFVTRRTLDKRNIPMNSSLVLSFKLIRY